jgi:PadR family transcriptional regulator PadR
MRLLSRKEEMILLAVWKLQDNAYGVTIREYIEKMTGTRWLFGAIYNPMGRLVDIGYIESYESDPVPERGGRRKTLYRLTSSGKKALVKVREVNAAMWADIPPLMEEL